MHYTFLAVLLASAFAAPANRGPGYIIRVADGTTLDGVLNAVPGLSKSGAKKFSLINGFTVPSSAAPLIEKLRLVPGVDSVEEDVIMTTLATQNNAPWGLQRVSSKSSVASVSGTTNERNPAYTYNYNEAFAGLGIDVYVVDTGIRCTHTAFGGRALCPTDANFFSSGVNVDDNGHGTHCAGTVGSSLYGVSKNVTLIGVKVLGADGSGATSNIIRGLEYAVNRFKTTGRPSVVSMSLGGGISTALDNAVKSTTQNGVHVAVAAGNENQDANNVSPARAGLNSAVITVGASDIRDARASFSNYGTPLAIFGPGVNVLSTWFRTDTDSNVISGTSMATPHVAGALAYLLSNPTYVKYTPAQLKQTLIALSRKGRVFISQKQQITRSTANNLLQIV